MDLEKPNTPELTKEKLRLAYLKFISAGMTEPTELQYDNEDVKQAEELKERWLAEIKEKSKGNADAEWLARLEEKVFYFNMGFRGLTYISGLRLDQLEQDLENTDNVEELQPETIEQIVGKVSEVMAWLPRPVPQGLEPLPFQEHLSTPQLFAYLETNKNRKKEESVRKTFESWFEGIVAEYEASEDKEAKLKELEVLFRNLQIKVGFTHYIDDPFQNRIKKVPQVRMDK